MDVIFFKLLALIYTILIICGTMLVPGYIVNSKILLLKEQLVANPETSLIKIGFLQKFNKMSDDDKQLIKSKSIWKAEEV